MTTKQGEMKKANSAYSFNFFFFPFPVSSLKILLLPIKTRLHVSYKFRLWPLQQVICASSLGSKVHIQQNNNFTGRAVMRVEIYLEDHPQFAHDFYHLHNIILRMC